jgi:hypothetical protein
MDQFDTFIPQNLVTFNDQNFYTAHNTTVSDIAEASYVLDKSDRTGCTTSDLLSFREKKAPALRHTNGEDTSISCDLLDNEESDASSQQSRSHDFCGYRPNQGLLSPIAHRLHKEVEESHVSSQWSPTNPKNDDDIHFLATESKNEIRKSIISAMDQVLYSHSIPSHMIKKFEAEALRGIRELGTRLVQYKTQLIQEMNNSTPHENRNVARDANFEFACEHNSVHMAVEYKRKRNGLDY